MCGIFGHKFTRPDRRVIPLTAALSVLMECRGRDSWGYLNINEKGLHVRKDVGPISQGLTARSLRGTTQLIAHTRAATTGKVNAKNAHPLRYAHVIGVHNGIVVNHGDLNKRYNRSFEVDSHHIFAHIADECPLSEIDGYGAAVYVDDRELQRVHLTKWNGGTLAVAQIRAAGQPLGNVFASTRDALVAALGVAGMLQDSEIWQLDDERHYSLVGADMVEHKDDKPKFRFGFRTVKTTSHTAAYGHRVGGSGPGRTTGSCDGCQQDRTITLISRWAMAFCDDCKKEFFSMSEEDKRVYSALSAQTTNYISSTTTMSPATFLRDLKAEGEWITLNSQEADDNTCTDGKCSKLHDLEVDPVHAYQEQSVVALPSSV